MVGRMERVELREIWKNEAKDFTSWLFENLEILGEELDIILSPDEMEKDVGSFSADITAEDSSGQKVLIENQLEKTDHDHLGKILTYVSNLDAKIAVWVSSNPRPEHERAIEWLNETGSGVEFYLVKVEAFRIGNSEPAPKFTIVTGPSEKTEVVGEEKKGFAERHRRRQEFWKSLLEKSKSKTPLHANISPSIYHYISTSAGTRGLNLVYSVTYKSGQVELYIDRGKEGTEENKNIFDRLLASRDEIEKDFGGPLTWQRLDDRRACRICKRFDYAGLSNPEKWDQLQQDMIDAMIKLENALKKHIKSLKI